MISASSLPPDLEALLRMGLAVLCGLAVGLNRAHHGSIPHPNRLRVHVLVGLSACLMVLAAGPEAEARSRVIQGVATGVGFLGAGEILVPNRIPKHGRPEVRGLSSAASIWFTAALGVTVAASSPLLGLLALALALVTLSDRRDGDGNGHGNGHGHAEAPGDGDGEGPPGGSNAGPGPLAHGATRAGAPSLPRTKGPQNRKR